MQGQMVNSKVNTLAIKRLVNLKEITSILDIGTGYGFLLAELSKQHALAATGIELSRQEADYAKNTLGLDVINTPLRNSSLDKASYDLVTTFEVIEHVSNPTDFINELTGYVKPGGYLLIMTDNFQSRMAKSLGAGFPKWIPHSHISHFSSDSLRKLLESTRELNIVKSMSFTPWEILARNAIYKLRRVQKTPSEAFHLTSTLNSEMEDSYKLFSLRKFVNKIWVNLTLSEKMDGDLIYFLTKRVT
jgi:2-polyprenyl-3-methyl-5-hydroxy-6-metoxy-1,4-benzoquinol methylase